jgi:hypothetical protein
MAFITVNGVVLPTPTDYSVAKMDISQANRNAKGTMVIDRITTKTKLTLKWAFVDADDLKTILNAVSKTYYDVTYIDPVTGGNVTSSFYCGDREVGMVSYFNGVPMYKDLGFDLIER